MADTVYKSTHIQNLFGVSYETVRNYAMEFEKYLSPTARPGSGKHRLFTPEDLKVFALIVQMKRDEGRTYEDIHGALTSGERGSVAEYTEDEIKAIALTREGLLIVEQQRERIRQLELLLAQSETRNQPLIDETTRLNERVRQKDDVIEETKLELKEARGQLRKLEREAGEAYMRGRLDELREQREKGAADI